MALTAIKEHPTKNDISVWESHLQFEAGNTYLFSLIELENTYTTLLTLDIQCAFPIENVEEKDNYGYISVKDIISYFGDDKWNEFKTNGNA